MKNTIQKLQVTITVVCLMLITACTQDSEVGPIGPQGPQGEQGIQGEQGPQGEPGQDGADGQDGTDGEDGNANVIASEWITADFTDLPFFTASMGILDSRFTQEIVGSAVILVYARQDFFEDSLITQLPFSQNNENYFYIVYADPGEIIIGGQSIDNETEEVFNLFDAFRYVIVPSNSTTGKSPKASILNEFKRNGVDINDYRQVANYFGLED